MELFVLLALILAIAAAVWAVIGRAWPLLCLAIAVILLCLTGADATIRID
jgi:hypothetical protein